MIDIEVVCNECGSALEYKVNYNKYDLELCIYPCPSCLEESYERGVSDNK